MFSNDNQFQLQEVSKLDIQQVEVNPTNNANENIGENKEIKNKNQTSQNISKPTQIMQNSGEDQDIKIDFDNKSQEQPENQRYSMHQQQQQKVLHEEQKADAQDFDIKSDEGSQRQYLQMGNYESINCNKLENLKFSPNQIEKSSHQINELPKEQKAKLFQNTPQSGKNSSQSTRKKKKLFSQINNSSLKDIQNDLESNDSQYGNNSEFGNSKASIQVPATSQINQNQITERFLMPSQNNVINSPQITTPTKVNENNDIPKKDSEATDKFKTVTLNLNSDVSNNIIYQDNTRALRNYDTSQNIIQSQVIQMYSEKQHPMVQTSQYLNSKSPQKHLQQLENTVQQLQFEFNTNQQNDKQNTQEFYQKLQVKSDSLKKKINEQQKLVVQIQENKQKFENSRKNLNDKIQSQIEKIQGIQNKRKKEEFNEEIKQEINLFSDLIDQMEELIEETQRLQNYYTELKNFNSSGHRHSDNNNFPSNYYEISNHNSQNNNNNGINGNNNDNGNIGGSMNPNNMNNEFYDQNVQADDIININFEEQSKKLINIIQGQLSKLGKAYEDFMQFFHISTECLKFNKNTQILIGCLINSENSIKINEQAINFLRTYISRYLILMGKEISDINYKNKKTLRSIKLSEAGVIQLIGIQEEILQEIKNNTLMIRMRLNDFKDPSTQEQIEFNQTLGKQLMSDIENNLTRLSSYKTSIKKIALDPQLLFFLKIRIEVGKEIEIEIKEQKSNIRLIYLTLQFFVEQLVKDQKYATFLSIKVAEKVKVIKELVSDIEQLENQQPDFQVRSKIQADAQKLREIYHVSQNLIAEMEKFLTDFQIKTRQLQCAPGNKILTKIIDNVIKDRDKLQTVLNNAVYRIPSEINDDFEKIKPIYKQFHAQIQEDTKDYDGEINYDIQNKFREVEKNLQDLTDFLANTNRNSNQYIEVQKLEKDYSIINQKLTYISKYVEYKRGIFDKVDELKKLQIEKITLSNSQFDIHLYNFDTVLQFYEKAFKEISKIKLDFELFSNQKFKDNVIKIQKLTDIIINFVKLAQKNILDSFGQWKANPKLGINFDTSHLQSTVNEIEQNEYNAISTILTTRLQEFSFFFEKLKKEKP